MDIYTLIKNVHVVTAFISITGFVIRGMLKLMDSSLIQNKLVRVAPHIIDTILLLSAIALVVMSRQYPFVTAWVTAKLFAVIVYIALGVMLMRVAKEHWHRVAAFGLALVTIAYILVVATTRQII